MNKLKILTAGIIKDNPVLVLVLGTCPFLAVTTQASNAIGMGIAATAVLVFSNIIISILKKIIPDNVRIPCFIVVIAGLVTLVQMIVQAYAPDINKSLGLYLPLIVVNCIILGRAEMFASKNSPIDSALDGIGMGIGFTLAMLVMGSIREILGAGTWFGMQVIPEGVPTMAVFQLAPGGFFVYGVLIAAVAFFTNGKGVKKKSFGCETCPSASVCNGAKNGGCEA